MRKAMLKRIKITGRNKMLHRKAGQNHFNAKQSRRTQLSAKKFLTVSGVQEKRYKAYLNQ